MAREGKPVQVYLTDSLRDKLLELTQETGRSISDEIRRAVERHLATRPKVIELPVKAEEVVAVVKPRRGRPPKKQP